MEMQNGNNNQYNFEEQQNTGGLTLPDIELF